MTVAAFVREAEAFPEATAASVEEAYDAMVSLQRPGIAYTEPEWLFDVRRESVVQEFSVRRDHVWCRSFEAILISRPRQLRGSSIVAALSVEPDDHDRLIAELAAVKSRVPA